MELVVFFNNGNAIVSPFSHDTLPRSNPSASGWLPDAGATYTLKSWREKESNFLSMKKSSLLETYDKLTKRTNEMQQRNFGVSQATFCSLLKL